MNGLIHLPERIAQQEYKWTSMGLGKNRGFKLKEILLVPHGGSKNDTIVTVEQKI